MLTEILYDSPPHSLATYSGGYYNLLTGEGWKAIDLIVGMSRIPRWAGQTRGFKSVAAHSRCVAAVAAKEVKLFALWHDASEGLLGDIPHPLKQLLPAYYQIERVLQDSIYIRMCGRLPTEGEKVLIHEADMLVLETDWRYFKDETSDTWNVASAEDAYRVFMDSHRLYGGEHEQGE